MSDALCFERLLAKLLGSTVQLVQERGVFSHASLLRPARTGKPREASPGKTRAAVIGAGPATLDAGIREPCSRAPHGCVHGGKGMREAGHILELEMARAESAMVET